MQPSPMIYRCVIESSGKQANCDDNDESPQLNIPDTQQSSMPQRFGFKKSGIYNPPNSNEEKYRLASEEVPLQDEELLVMQPCAPFADLVPN